jgi:hypothetical protein
MSVNRTIGLELRDGQQVGRDPRHMRSDEIAALGHAAMSPLRALRLRCVDCSGGSTTEVRLCTAIACPAWPFRMGKNPWRAPASEARRDRARTTIVTTRARRAKNLGQEPGPDERQDGAATTLAAGIPGGQNAPGTRGETAASRTGGNAALRHAVRVDGGVR